MSAYHTNQFSAQLPKFVGARYYVTVAEPDKQDIHRTYQLHEKRNGRVVAGFTATPLPGCCGVLVVYRLIAPLHPNQTDLNQTDLLNYFLSAATKAAEAAKFGALVCTSFANVPIALGSSSSVTEFVNGKTRNNLKLMLRTFNHEPSQQELRINE